MNNINCNTVFNQFNLMKMTEYFDLEHFNSECKFHNSERIENALSCEYVLDEEIAHFVYAIAYHDDNHLLQKVIIIYGGANFIRVFVQANTRDTTGKIVTFRRWCTTCGTHDTKFNGLNSPITGQFIVSGCGEKGGIILEGSNEIPPFDSL